MFKWLCSLLFKAFLYSIRHPRSSTALVLTGAATLILGWKTIVGFLVVLSLGMLTWRITHRLTFERFIGAWLRTWLRRWWTYCRRWNDTLARCELVVEANSGCQIPRLMRVSTTPYWDRLSIRLRVGQEIDDYRQAAERLRHAFGAERIAVREIKPAFVGVDFMRRDPLRYEAVPAAPMPATTADIDFTAVPIGLTEHLEPLTISVVGGHLAASGASGAGKAGVEWNIFRSLAPAIADGTVRPVLIDPKGRELRQGRSLASPDDYAVSAEEVLALLERLVAEMEAANEAAGVAGERDFVPSPMRPLVLVNIDELAPLLAYWPRRIRDKIEDCLGLLLTQGRAAGYIVIGLIQEPTKDIFKIRDLFGRRLALRLPTSDHTDAALADNATDRGAQSHEIPESLPGVLFALQDGAKTAIRGRLGHVTDADIAELVEYVSARKNVIPIGIRRMEQGLSRAA